LSDLALDTQIDVQWVPVFEREATMKRMAGLIAALAQAALIAACGGGEESNTTPIAIVGPVTGQ
jgi:hypothetical protein